MSPIAMEKISTWILRLATEPRPVNGFAALDALGPQRQPSSTGWATGSDVWHFDKNLANEKLVEDVPAKHILRVQRAYDGCGFQVAGRSIADPAGSTGELSGWRMANIAYRVVEAVEGYVLVISVTVNVRAG